MNKNMASYQNPQLNQEQKCQTSFCTSSVPPEDESPRLPWQSYLEQHRHSEGKLTDLPQSSASESYAFVPTPTSDKDNPMFRPDLMLYKVQKLTKTMKS